MGDEIARVVAFAHNYSPDVHVLQLDAALLELRLVELDRVVGAVLPERLVVVAVGTHVAPVKQHGFVSQ